jgi:Protein of Unknown function (DUF2784)
MWYAASADLVVIVHLLFIAFVAGGAFLAWRWPWIILAHIPAVAYGALVEFVSFTCPLTLLENELRQRAGEAGYGGGFVAHYLIKVIYPPGLTHGMQIGLGFLVLLIAVLGYAGFFRRRRVVSIAAGYSQLESRQVIREPEFPGLEGVRRRGRPWRR